MQYSAEGLEVSNTLLMAPSSFSVLAFLAINLIEIDLEALEWLTPARMFCRLNFQHSKIFLSYQFHWEPYSIHRYVIFLCLGKSSNSSEKV